MSRKTRVNGNNTWGELAIGATFNPTKNTAVHFDLERTTGARIDQDFRVNVGVRVKF